MIRTTDLVHYFPNGVMHSAFVDVGRRVHDHYYKLNAEELAGQPNRRQVEAALRHLNNVHGKGDILEIIWGTRAMGTDQTDAGMVVRRMQYSMDARPFRVSRTQTRIINFLGRWRRIPQEALDGE